MSEPVTQILLVEDNPADVLLVRETLADVRTAQYDVVCSERLRDALAWTRRHTFDAVLLGLGLPDSDGLDSLRRLRDQSPSVPVIVMTGLPDEDLALRAAREGAQDYMIKGQFSAPVLARIIRYAIERNRADQALRDNEERLALAMEINRTGAFDVDVVQNVVRRTLEHDRIFGYEALHPNWSEATFFEHVIAEDRERVRDEHRRTFTGARDEWAFECRIRRFDGAIRWIAVRGRTRRLDTGQIGLLTGVVQDITERKQIEEEVRQLNVELEARVTQRTSELEAANRELEAFSYSVSHDLQTPLRALDGYSKIVLEDFGASLPGEAQRYLERISDSAQRMGQLIVDLLRFSRLSRHALNKGLVDMRLLARECSQELRFSPHGGRATIEIAALPPAHGDAALLKQVWMNLLANAMKYSRSHPSPRIDVGSTVEDGRVVYFVRDNGVGFDMRHAGKLFGVFQRLHAAEEFEGTGAGLAIVHRIVERHGGRIWAEGAVGQGASFSFSLGKE